MENLVQRHIRLVRRLGDIKDKDSEIGIKLRKAIAKIERKQEREKKKTERQDHK